MGSNHSKQDESFENYKKQNKLKSRLTSFKSASLRRDYYPEPKSSVYFPTEEEKNIRRRCHSSASVDVYQGDENLAFKHVVACLEFFALTPSLSTQQH